MSIEIKSRYGDKTLYVAENAIDVRQALQEAVKSGAYLSGAYLSGAYLSGAYLSGADLSGADLRGAYLSGADLRGAYLSGADLRGAYLRGAYLRGAYLSGADLSGANLSGAYLSGAIGLNPKQHNELRILLDQPGRVRAYKLVNADGEGPFQGGITYTLGETCSVANADTDESSHCGAGINLATLPWCVQSWRKGYRILIAEFTAKDISAIPLSDGKFRVRKCKIVGEVDLVDLGLVEASETSQENA